jgi:DnaJ family protein C protein 27
MSSYPVPARLPPKRIKVMIVGDAGSGKTCLIRRYCEGAFEQRYIPTVCVDYGVRALSLQGTTDVRANFYDSSGSPSYLVARSEFYREAEGLLLVFDVGDGGALERLDLWLGEAERCGMRGGIPIVLCGTKVDEVHRRAVPRGAAEKWAKEHPGVAYFEASAASGVGVKDAVEALLTQTWVDSARSGGSNKGGAVSPRA